MASTHRDEISRLELLHAAHPDGLVFPHLADAYRRAGRYSQAESILAAGLRRHKDYASAYVVMGRLRLDQAKPDEAAAAFRRVLQLDSQNQVALEYLGDIAADHGRPEEALDYLRKLRRIKRDPVLDARIAGLQDEVSSPDPGAAEPIGDAPARHGAATAAVRGELSTTGPVPTPEAPPTPDPPASEAPSSRVSSSDGAVADVATPDVPGSGPAAPESPAEREPARRERAPTAAEEYRTRDAERRRMSGNGGGRTPLSRKPEPGEVVTETMAELYARQGLFDRAAAVYRELLQITPEDTRLKAKLERVEDRMGRSRTPAAPSGGHRAPAERDRPVSSGAGIRDELTALLGWSRRRNGAAATGPAPTVAEPPPTSPAHQPPQQPMPQGSAQPMPTGESGQPVPRGEPGEPMPRAESGQPVPRGEPREPAPPSEVPAPDEAPADPRRRTGLSPWSTAVLPGQDLEEPETPDLPVLEEPREREVEDPWPAIPTGLALDDGMSKLRGAGTPMRALLALADMLVGLLEYRDPFFRGSSSLTRLLATSVAEEMGLSPEEQVDLALAAVLRDLGRLALGGRLLPVPRLNPTGESLRKIERHVDLALHLLEGIDLPPAVRQAVRHHHERWDGAGYPDALAGENIPILARILAVVDSFTAMVSPRPYRLPRKVPDAAQELKEEAATRYDPAVVAALLRVIAGREQPHLGFEQRHHVLLVNPDQPGAVVTAAKLCSAGYLAEVMGDGAAARERLRRVPVAALVVSAGMGEAAAADFVRDLRADPSFGTLPIVVVDADGVALRVRLLEAGADVCFPTGISHAELQGTLGALVRRTLREKPKQAPAEGGESTWLALQGDIEDFPLTWLLQVMKYDSRTAAIGIRTADREGAIYLRQGDAVHAQIRHGGKGEQALRDMLKWRKGRFTVQPDARPREQTIQTSIMHLLLTSAVAEDHAAAGIFGAVSAEG